MRERHHRSERKHPPACTCTVCQAKRVAVATPKTKKRRKPKSQRGKGSKKQAADAAVTEVMEMLGLSDDEKLPG